MKILVTGASGLIGSALVPSLTGAGHTVTRLVRSKPRPGEIRWDPLGGDIDKASLEGQEAVIHLAGESIAGRWTAEKKKKIRESRLKGTKLLAESLSQLASPPKVLLCASAIGYYGDRGDELLREESPAGSGFLAKVCREWEAAADRAVRESIRVVRLRNGIVLSAAGGALKTMLLPFKLGVGGKIGSGMQYMSWIAIDDVLGIIHLAITNDTLRGPVNVVAPNPVTNLVFTKTLGRVIGRPTVLPMPAFAARLVLGEMAEELLLASTRVTPRRLLAADYHFKFPQLESALRSILGKTKAA
jgi:uncharacterized protein (TIGR01777 family)